MRLHVVDHPLVAHKLTTLRDQRTDSATFRRLADELVTLLAYEATRDVRTEQVDIRTPVSQTTGVKLSHPRPLVVPILRAGLGMLDGMVRLLPTAEVGFLGMVRNEETLQASTYATRMPDDLSGRQVYVLDPMLATGGTLVASIKELMKRGADDVTAVVLLAAPEGVELMERELAGTPVTVVTALGRRASQRAGLHRPGPRRRGRPHVRSGRVVPRGPLSSSSSPRRASTAARSAWPAPCRRPRGSQAP
ncbi:uracil phosphoribosyltransferase [Streptomyces ambofaciens]